MKLETERLLIVPCTAEVVTVLTEQNYKNGPQVWGHLEKLAEDPSILYWGPWLALLKSNSTVIGDLGFKGKPDNKGAVEIGYGLLEEYWHKGYATEAVGALMDWAWQQGVRKIKAETLRGNPASIRVLEKLGMNVAIKSDDMIYWEKNKA
ncbi:GNAT family acetyltransferase [Planococcus salinarum]|uniref:GNAT family acetyltransferase n=1 Tax=Planococcus salinarum TaxID=622695 RepID=A0ABX3D284_9BACL|nr:GNAT family N-acetyltransferase [Planococcus salinarum]OHX52516.1 GNAT family acetyltransferase [Planococcus salinarum]TAA72248.1 N-acetyltransferase [Planococcus salinarum]